MQIITHKQAAAAIAEVVSDKIVINTIDDGKDLVGNLYFQGFDGAIIHQDAITPGFFDLKTGIAGEILQKFSNYKIRLAIVGSFEHYQSKSLSAFIFECNNGRQVNFVASRDQALGGMFK
ncbi:MAG: DUF4180 domain-containing protein [Bacteroidota bacterium]